MSFGPPTNSDRVHQFSNAAASVVGSVLGRYYYHHATIEQLFDEARAPGPVPQGSCESKTIAWLKRVASDAGIDGLRVLGAVLEEFMDTDICRNFTPEMHQEQMQRVRGVLTQEGLEYVRGGRIISACGTMPARQLDDMLRSRDLGGVNHEFERALTAVTTDAGAAATAACAILESLCKVYIEDHGLEKPKAQTLEQLWRVVQSHLGLDPKSIEDQDLRQILSGLSSVTHGLAGIRTHAGSAHGRGRTGYKLQARHARLVVNASHTLAVFLIETWEARDGRSPVGQQS